MRSPTQRWKWNSLSSAVFRVGMRFRTASSHALSTSNAISCTASTVRRSAPQSREHGPLDPCGTIHQGNILNLGGAGCQSHGPEHTCARADLLRRSQVLTKSRSMVLLHHQLARCLASTRLVRFARTVRIDVAKRMRPRHAQHRQHCPAPGTKSTQRSDLTSRAELTKRPTVPQRTKRRGAVGSKPVQHDGHPQH